MRFLSSIFIALLIAVPILAQDGRPDQPGVTDGKVQLAAARKRAKPKRAAPAKRDDGLSVAERMVIQYELAWTGDFTGLVTGEPGEKTTEAVKSFQSNRKYKETGVLSAQERTTLATAARARQERVGWTIVEDAAIGAQLGIPTSRVPQKAPGTSGTRWSSAQGQIQVETFRIREPGTTLEQVYEEERKEAGRRINGSLLKGDFFALAGMQRLKFFVVRAVIKDDEVRGVTVLWDQAADPVMGYIGTAMPGAFTAFPTMAVAQPGEVPRRKVEYGTGIAVSAAGHILTDRRLVDGCNVITVAGHGDAARVAADDDVALVRLYGAPALVPAALAHDGAQGGDLTLVGIADPQSQGGGHAVSTATGKLNGGVLAPAPPAGYAGGAVLDGQGRIYGMVQFKPPAAEAVGAAAAQSQASVVPLPAIRAFLAAQKLTPPSGRAGVDAVKAALVRVICARK